MAAAAAVVAVLAVATGAFVLAGGDGDGSRTVAGPGVATPSIEGTWRLAAILHDGAQHPARGGATITIDGDSMTGTDGCGNALETVLGDGIVTSPGFHTVAGCIDDAANDEAISFWAVLEQEPTYEMHDRELRLLAEQDGLVFARAGRDEVVPTEILDGVTSPNGDLVVTVGSCNDSPTGEVVESDTTVTVTAYAPPPSENADSCADSLTLSLDRPLGDRAVIDGSTGMTVAVQRPGSVHSGDHVRVVADHETPPGNSTSATMFESPEAVAERWPPPGTTGPAPTFDGREWDAVIIELAQPDDCPGLHETLILDGSQLRFLLTGDDGSEVSCKAPPVAGGRVVVALVAQDAAPKLHTVLYRDRRIPLSPAE